MIETHVHAYIHEIRLSRPPVNALNQPLLKALINAIEQAITHGARGLILSGNPKVFSGGLDVPELLKLDPDQLRETWASFFAAARVLANSPIPIVAAIAGHSPAGGCVFALCCDYRIMARGPYRIGLNETQVGLPVTDAIQYLMRRVIGNHRAERLIVAGTMLESAQALNIGLVDELTDGGEVVARALHWLHELLALPSTPMLTTRNLARADMVTALDGFTDAHLDQFLNDWYSPDTQAALQALLARLKK